MPAFSYAPRVTDSTMEPIAVLIDRDGVPLEPLGVTVTVTVKTRTVPRQTIVQDEPATPVQGAIGRWEFYFAPGHMAQISSGGVWLVEWKIKVGEYAWRTDTLQLPVRRKL